MAHPDYMEDRALLRLAIRRIRSNKASKGQIIIFVALFAVVLTAMVGLSVDLGYAFAERRTVQNAADSAAIAGAHALNEWSTSNPGVRANTEVASMVSKNKMGSSTNQTFSCSYVDDANNVLANCDQPIPSGATGVHVEVHETHNTFFIRVLPGGPKNISTAAAATAHIQAVNAGEDAPFVVCGINTYLAGGGTMSIITKTTANAPSPQPPIAQMLEYSVGSGTNYQVQFLKNSQNSNVTPTPVPNGASGATSNYTINSAAVGHTFLLHAPQVADCGLHSDKFKGVAAQDSNASKSIPDWFDVENGDKAGPTRTRVNGIDGCKAGDTNPDGCIMIVPIATDSPAPTSGRFYVVASAAFKVSSCSPSGNCHAGTLIGNYQIAPPPGMVSWSGSNGWRLGYKGLTAERLTK